MKKFIALLFFILLLSGCGVNSQKSQGEEVSPDSNIETKEGTYVGLADTHTIEVTVDNEAVSLDITEESTSDLDKFNNGDKVTITYEKSNEGQLLLKDIERAN
ncbi:membrane-bound protein LytA [Bacillus stercoris]|uniref:membrane-bound protein LytA n=1 Tax=Bacillus TaxID=1386 RepID=UPI00249BE16E|nr:MULTISPECIES: membrane-bound protein LytA [Bacillus]MDN0192100.1 membrane-bound protein LytA [Bacillus sp. B.PNR1]MDN3033006.1 membrane-bound protein LytA [Bacillus sp. B.PNR2]WGV94991.1 membrane-bound protein LytA [Bacillus stercoris]